MKVLTRGEKIKEFRKRLNLSQLDLELEIDASPGSISRIESGKVNPTKETILKISDVLKLNAREMADLFNININEEIVNFIKLSNKIIDNNLENLLQNSVDEIVKELKLLGCFIALLEKDTLYAKTFTNTWYTKPIEKLLNKTFQSFTLDLNHSNQNNLIIKTVKERQSFHSLKLAEHITPPLSPSLANIVQKITGQKSAVSMPLIFKNKCIGIIYFSKNYIDNFHNEMEILKAFAEYISSAIINLSKNIKNEMITNL